MRTKTHTHLPFSLICTACPLGPHPRTRITPAREKRFRYRERRNFPTHALRERNFTLGRHFLLPRVVCLSFFTAAAPATIDDRSFCCVPFQGASAVCMLVGNIYCVRGVGWAATLRGCTTTRQANHNIGCS